MSRALPYKYSRDGEIWAYGLSHEEALELQSRQGGWTSPDFDRLPPRRREPIRDLPLNETYGASRAAQPGGAGAESLQLAALNAESGASPVKVSPTLYSPVPPTRAELASGRRQDAGPGANCPANGASLFATTAVQHPAGDASPQETPHLRDWAIRKSWHRLQGLVRKVVGQ